MLGPCFTAERVDPAICKHPPTVLFAWYARDDTAKTGKVLVVVCMACDTINPGEQKRVSKRTRRTARTVSEA